MVKVSTLFYVLENLEDAKIFDIGEICDLEEKYLQSVFLKVDQAGLDVNPAIINNILQKTGSV